MKHFAIGFALTCICGLLVALAGGIQWGTPEAGRCMLLTFSFANLGGCALSFFVCLFNDDGWND